MEKKRLFFQFVWTRVTRLSSRTAPLCSPLLTDSLSQEARGLYACPQKILNPQGRVILAGLWGGGLYFLRQSTRFTAPAHGGGLHITFENAPPGWSRGLKERKTAGVGGGSLWGLCLLFIVFILTGSCSCCFTLFLIERNQQTFFFFS